MTQQSTGPEFELKIVSQGWLGPPEEWASDLCTHGEVRAVIAGVVVSRPSTEYGISQSALALLRTLDRDHSPERPVIESGYLLGHGCGFPLWPCPNFGIDWSVVHGDGSVHIGDVRDAGVRVHHELSATVPLEHYRHEVIGFARHAREFYLAAGPKRIDDSLDRQGYEAFWAEFNDVLGT